MKVDYVLETTTLCGGVKVVFEQAEHLKQYDIKLRIISYEGKPDWISSSLECLKVDTLNAELFENTDFIIGTNFFHVLVLYQYPQLQSKMIHLIQGYEGGYTEAKEYLQEIRQCYELNIPKWTVSERLKKQILTLYPKTRYIENVGQAINHNVFYPAATQTVGKRPFSILLMGTLYNSSKDINKALEVLSFLKQKIPELHIVRISLHDYSEEERLTVDIDEYYSAINAEQVAKVMRQNTFFLSTSTEAEGFGLPLLEAMASGMICFARSISSYRDFSSPNNYCYFFKSDHSEQMASEMVALMINEAIHENFQKNAINAARQYNYNNISKRIYALLKSMNQ